MHVESVHIENLLDYVCEPCYRRDWVSLLCWALRCTSLFSVAGNPILSPQGSHLPPCSHLLKIPFISLSLARKILGKDMLVVSTVTLRHRTNKTEKSILVFCFLCFYPPVELEKKALFQRENKGCLNKQVNAVTVAFVLQPFSYKQFQITLQYQPQCVLCLEKIPLIIKAQHKKQS